MVVLSDDYVLHFDYFILEFLNVTILIDSVDNERTAEPQNHDLVMLQICS